MSVVSYRSPRRSDHSSRGVLPRCGVSECYREALVMRTPWPAKECYIFKNSQSLSLPNMVNMMTC